MKRLYLSLIAGLGLSVATTGFAFAAEPVLGAGGGSAPTVAVNGAVAPQCKVTGTQTATFSGTAAAGLADANGFLASSALPDLLTALNATNTFAWCSGVSKIAVGRTPLVRDGTNGAIDTSGFVNAIGYDVAAKIVGASRTIPEAGYDDQEGTSDGAGSGPTFNPFGPTGNGLAVTFIGDAWTGNGTFGTTAVPLNLSVSPSYDGATSGLTGQVVANTTRLAAGTYKSTVTLVLTPQV
jgi:hypothetical protein